MSEESKTPERGENPFITLHREEIEGITASVVIRRNDPKQTPMFKVGDTFIPRGATEPITTGQVMFKYSVVNLTDAVPNVDYGRIVGELFTLCSAWATGFVNGRMAEVLEERRRREESRANFGKKATPHTGKTERDRLKKARKA